jgi:hypothetical protein
LREQGDVLNSTNRSIPMSPAELCTRSVLNPSGLAESGRIVELCT